MNRPRHAEGMARAPKRGAGGRGVGPGVMAWGRGGGHLACDLVIGQMWVRQDGLNMSEGFVCIDLQGFKTTANTFIPKEISILTDGLEFHYILKSPCTYNQLEDRYKREAIYLSRAHHGLHFDANGIPLEDFVDRTLEHMDGKTCFVKGAEKIKWLEQMFYPWSEAFVFRNVEDLPVSFEFEREEADDILHVCPEF